MLKSNLNFFKEISFGLINKIIGGGKYPPGHFYSPVPHLSDYKDKIELSAFPGVPEHLPGINLYLNEQTSLISEFGKILSSEPQSKLQFPAERCPDSHYYTSGKMYGVGDALVLAAFIGKYKPKTIIEVGSGMSTAAMVDAIKHFKTNTQIYCIEPYPDRLMQLDLLDYPALSLLKSKVQLVDLQLFRSLNENDILFIDSSHVSKFDSDVNHLIFNVLPILNKGVIIHFHDIHFPFSYEHTLLQRGYFWNESYILRAFLQYNSNFKIEWFSHFLTLYRTDELRKNIPDYLKNGGGSIWIKRVS